MGRDREQERAENQRLQDEAATRNSAASRQRQQQDAQNLQQMQERLLRALGRG